MNLYNDILMIQSTNKEQMIPINIIITKCLKYIKKKAISDIKARRPIIKENEIKWILTVPAIWKDKCKDIMIKSAKKAKILNSSNEELFLALEPEAAAYEYFNNPASDKNLISINKPYIICDLGGGTVDITTHQRINENGKIIIEELYPPIGGYNGSTLINKEFKNRILKKIFGKAYDSLMNCIQKPNESRLLYSDWLENQIENFKIQLSLENVKNKETERINCTIFKEFIGNFSINQLKL
jgi:molecular chaperone DnaK (HSP70)